MRTIEELLKLVPEVYEITVFGAEPHGNYNRILLSPVLAGEKGIEQIMINDERWYTERGITLHKGREVVRINRSRHQVIAADGTIESYDRLLLATGSNPFIIPIPGNDLPGVITFRDIRDVEAMLAAARAGLKHAVVIGGGLLGLEAANGLVKQGMQVTVVHLLDTLMERQLDPAAAALLKRNLEERGLRFLMAAQTTAILGEEQVRGVRFKDGLEISADLVVMAVGIRPNIELAKSAGLHCERGIVVNDTLQTFDPRIYAVGECVEHRRTTYGLVAPLYEQAAVCARHLAELGTRRYAGSMQATQLKVTGVEVFSAGEVEGGAGTEAIVLRDARRGVYKRVIVADGRLRGALLYGDIRDAPWYTELLKSGRSVAELREQLLFGPTAAAAS
jgi:nitrite reductase (NADH) large subunit